MDQLFLTEFVEGDSGPLIEWVNGNSERHFWQWGGGAVFRYPLNAEQVEAHVKSAVGDRPVRKLLKGTDEKGRMVGYQELNRINWENRSAVVSRVLVVNPAERGKGYGHQLLRGLIEMAFRDMDLLTLTLEVFDFNGAALKVYERLGFVRTGTKHYTVLGETWTAIVMQLTREDWDRHMGGRP